MCLNETCNEVCTCKQLSDASPIQNGLKQGDNSPPLLFNFPLVYAITKVQENKVGPELTDQLLLHADDISVDENMCLGMMVTKQNCTHDKIKSRLDLGNAFYHAVQNLLSS
jgi:hypothetical protein